MYSILKLMLCMNTERYVEHWMTFDELLSKKMSSCEGMKCTPFLLDCLDMGRGVYSQWPWKNLFVD